VIEENELGFGRDGMVIWGGGAVTITRNEITSTTGGDNAIVIKGTLGGVAAGGPIAITNNIISGKNIGIYIGDVSGAVDVHTNSISGTTSAALQTQIQHENQVINATANWWGSANGPTSPLNIWAGVPKGDRIIGPGAVIFAPWLTDGIDADPAARGFQHAGPDMIAPAISSPDLDPASDSGTSDHDNITKDNTPSFTGTAEPGATVDLMEGTSVLGTTSADALGNWTITSSILTTAATTSSPAPPTVRATAPAPHRCW
jgi:hypothetical protein